MDKEFCLLEKPWIKVLNQKNTIKEISLLDLFANAHKYKRLAGETVTQDVAILRLLLAVTITVFYRYNVDGEEDNVLDYDDPEEEILKRWEDYWEKNEFNSEVFKKYLETYRERFYLFHPEMPFWQVANLKEGTNYNVINLLGNVKESNNSASKHHFHMVDGTYIRDMSYAEVARWIVYNNAYSVNVKTKVDGKSVATGVGRLGQLGFIMALENNIYKDIMLNLCALHCQGDYAEAWKEPKPIWEQKPREEIGVNISPPKNLPQLYTIQSRRLLLKKNGSQIEGFKSIGGDYYSVLSDFVEPMTLLRWNDKEKHVYKPKKHEKVVSVWREFPSILEQELKPGVVCWLEKLVAESLLNEKSIITFAMVGLEYGDGMSYTNGEIVCESLSMSKDLLNQTGKVWITLIADQVNKCEQVVKKCFKKFSDILAVELYKGDKKGTKKIQEALATEYFFKVDKAFKEWLISIRPEICKRDVKEKEWQETSAMLAQLVLREYTRMAPPQLVLVCAKAFKAFKKELYRVYPKNAERGEKNE